MACCKADLGAINEALDPYWPRIEALGVESIFNWYWLVDGLQTESRTAQLGDLAKMVPAQSFYANRILNVCFA